MSEKQEIIKQMLEMQRKFIDLEQTTSWRSSWSTWRTRKKVPTARPFQTSAHIRNRLA
jgi:hypothetical protein